MQPFAKVSQAVNAQTDKTIYLVDDDPAVCHSLTILLEASGYSVQTFTAADGFMEVIEDVREGIMLLDQRMTGITGLELQAELKQRGIELPIIFITGHGDVPMSVKAIKAGAINFLMKPFSNEILLKSIKEAFSLTNVSRIRTEIWKRCRSLTDREREVMVYVIAGKPNGIIAERLEISTRTIEVHRSRAMQKMGAGSLADLVRKCTLCQESALPCPPN